jgi:type II secretory pathway component PulK
MVSNERGIALIITLLVVALLAITVVEFTYSVEIDQRMTRNSLNGVQAALLARSGISLGEAYLLHDNNPQVDAFTEDWCPMAGPDAQSCLLDETNSQMVVPENMRLRVQILDEGAKFNVNATRPLLNVQQLDQWQQMTGTNPTSNPLTIFESLCAARGVDAHVVDALVNYWRNAFAAADQAASAAGMGGTPGPTPGASPAAAAAPAAALQSQQQVKTQILQQYEFASLDDLGVIPGITPRDINRLRPVLTAQRGRPPMNINTAPRAVLNAVFTDHPERVDDIISQRQNGPMQQVQMQGAAQGITPAATSTLFLIRASAIVNPDPVTGRGGIRRSASMLVLRGRAIGPPTGSATALPGGQHWTLRRLDWQKEGGAVLFEPRSDGDLGTGDATSPTAADTSGWMTN